MNVEIQEVTEASPELVAAFRKLLPQLASSPTAPSERELGEMLGSQALSLFVAKSPDGKILGMLTLVTLRLPSGVRAWIEDVVVDDGARGLGCGSELCQAAIAKSRSLGATSVNLTSRPSRVAANRLYQKLGFELRETNVYRYKL